jgi:hypothetical protein
VLVVVVVVVVVAMTSPLFTLGPAPTLACNCRWDFYLDA